MSPLKSDYSQTTACFTDPWNPYRTRYNYRKIWGPWQCGLTPRGWPLIFPSVISSPPHRIRRSTPSSTSYVVVSRVKPPTASIWESHWVTTFSGAPIWSTSARVPADRYVSCGGISKDVQLNSESWHILPWCALSLSTAVQCGSTPNKGQRSSGRHTTKNCKIRPPRPS